MSELRLPARGGEYDRVSAPAAERTPRVARRDSGGSSLRWVIAGAAVVAGAYIAWQRFGPDILRYIKMRRM